MVALAVRATNVQIVQLQDRNKVQAKASYCPVNHDGSSRLMEVNIALDLTGEMYVKPNGKVFVEALVSNDNYTMRMLLKHQKNNPKGKLNSDNLQPTFLADLSHRIKVMSRPVLKW